GRGFTEPYVWNYLSPMRALPSPSHVYWMPLTSVAAAPFIAWAELLAGRPLPNDTLFRAAQIPMVLAASALPLLSYAVAQHISGQRRHTLAAALLTVFSAYYFPYWPNTDSFALYAIVAAGALFIFARASVPRPLSWFFCGLLCGLSHLARADGVLVLLCIILFAAFATRSGHLPLVTRHLPFILIGYLVIMAPWFFRNWLVIGAPLAPGGARVLWLTNYNDLFVYDPAVLTLERYLALGWGAIVRDKWEALAMNVQSFIATQTNIFGLPLVVIGWWRLRGHRLYQLALLYGLALLAAMSLAFTFPGPLGGYLHSGAALLPFVWPAALVGLDAVVEAIAKRLKHWQPEKSNPVFTALLVLGAVALTAAVSFGKLVGADPRNPPSAQADTVYADIGAVLASESTVAVNNPPAFHYFTGLQAIVIPTGGPDTLVRAMDDFGARWLVLDRNIVPELWPLYENPTGDPRLALRQTFVSGGGNVYLFERVDP
ncbi:MAG: hypothetical protein ACT4QE_03345, partial [Anaerolineales bacterium]